MAYRKLENVEERVIAAVTKIGARDGVLAATALKVARECDMSDFTVLQCFGSKRGYLDAAAQAYDRRLMEKIYGLIDKGDTFADIWDKMMRYHLDEDPDGVLYYNHYINEVGFDPTPNNERSDEWLPMAKALFSTKSGLTDDQYLLLWDFITMMSLYYAEKIITGYIPDTDEAKGNIRRVVFAGLDGF